MNNRLIIGAVVFVVAFVGIAAALSMVLQPIAQPSIVLTPGFLHVKRGVDSCHGEYAFSFGLVNTGIADGFANVEFSIDGRVMGNTEFFVPAFSSIQASYTWVVEECVPQSSIPAIGIESFWKG